jgi:hypothetical protein
MAELCPSLDQRRLRRLLRASQEVSSASGRMELRAAIAVRLATLGEVEAALRCFVYLDSDHAPAALQQIADIVPPATIPWLIEEVRSRVDFAAWNRGPQTNAALGRRMGELAPAELSRLLDRWHALAPERGKVLVDLLMYSPAMLALGGSDSADDLVGHLETL